MKRRDFIKQAGLIGACYGFGMAPRLKLHADDILITQSMLLGQIDYVKPAVLPKVINIFLYGGPSELAGNLSNIQEINANSQNSYPGALLGDPGDAASEVTANYFWKSAGGSLMETMLANNQMSVYRTIHRRKDDHKGHGRSVAQNLVGQLNTQNPGFATTLSAILSNTNPFGKEINDLVLPVVTFEGNSVVFQKESLVIPDILRPVALDYTLTNSYTRTANSIIGSATDERLESMARSISSMHEHHLDVQNAFAKRSAISAFIESKFSASVLEANLPTDPDTGTTLLYPDTTFGRQMKAAMSLAIENDDTFFISIGGGGLGGWDDHSNAMDNYPTRMNNLMSAIQVALKHAELKGNDRIAINVFGDFGRNVNLNNSGGWDHGNNQNLYTFGGSGIADRTLGQIFGETTWSGTANENRQFTVPAAGSYEAEPFSIASTIYRYFGIRNPEILTGEPILTF